MASLSYDKWPELPAGTLEKLEKLRKIGDSDELYRIIPRLHELEKTTKKPDPSDPDLMALMICAAEKAAKQKFPNDVDPWKGKEEDINSALERGLDQEAAVEYAENAAFERTTGIFRKSLGSFIEVDEALKKSSKGKSDGNRGSERCINPKHKH